VELGCLKNNRRKRIYAEQ
jgi:hypothetical protein